MRSWQPHPVQVAAAAGAQRVEQAGVDRPQQRRRQDRQPAQRRVGGVAGQAVDLLVETSNRDVPHRRRLDLEFEDGRSLRVRFDQGIAYWQVRFGSHAEMWFDFDLEAQDQLMHMAKVVETAKVQNSEQKWATDVLVELRRI
mgnify:CR=1 FL=1